MKTLLKLILIGIIGGIAWKYLDDKNINISGKIREIAKNIEEEISSIDAKATTNEISLEERGVELPLYETQTYSVPSSGRQMVTQSVAGAEIVSDQPSEKWNEPAGSSIEWVKEMTKRYSPDSWQLLMNYDALPMSSNAKLNDGSTSGSNKPAGTFSYLEDTEIVRVLSSMSTNVHEIGHGYFHYNLYSYAKENNIMLDWNSADGFLYVSQEESFYISFPSKYLFPSRELMKVIPSTLETFRFDPYIDGNISTQEDGVIGLLDELHAYYLGSRCAYDLLEAYKSVSASDNIGLIEWIKNTSSEMTAFYEFDYFIKEYLLYMKTNYPANYELLKGCRNFCLAYAAVREHYNELIVNYGKRVDSEIEKINSSGVCEAHLNGKQLWIKDKSTGRSSGIDLFHEDREKLLPILESSRFNDVISGILN
ncbi:MAG: hypothetical protein ACM3NR_02770 [Methanosarcina sp.]